MSSPSEDAARPRRLHPAAAALSVLGAIRQFVPLIVLALLTGEGKLSSLACTFGLIGPVSLAVGVGRWLRFRYWVEAGELRIEQGLLLHRRTFVPGEHVQAVDVTAGVLQRVFGLVKVQIKTATAGTAVELAAVSREEAERLRRSLDGRRAAQAEEGPPAPSVRYALSWRDLLLAASTSGQLGVILSALFYVYTKLEEYYEAELLRWLERLEVSEVVPTADPLFLALLVAGGVLVAWLLSIGVVVSRYGGFAVELRGGDLVVERGLLERRTIVIPGDRIQAIRVSEGLLRQPLGYGAVYVESAGHAEEKGESTYLHPFLHRSRWEGFLAELAPGFPLPADLELTRPPRRALRRFLLRPLISAAAVAGLLALWLPYGALGFLLLVPAALAGFVAYRDTGLALLDGIAVLRSRRLERVTAILPRRRAQFVETERSLFQRRLRLGTCLAGAASGAGGRVFEVPELDEEVCYRFVDWAWPPSSKGRHTPSAPRSSQGLNRDL